ncbi:MAG TPA: hypothetical protein VKB88_18810 [Bryobacteraceae bacterium]|nr:hypothetical protein [Bryobacteraceae bacterium]
MPTGFDQIRRQFERGVVILSFDTEQIWGYLDLFDEAHFRRRYPDSLDAHTKILASLSEANISATWFVVGAMAIHGSQGERDGRMAGLPYKWTCRIPAGNEVTAPLWYRPALLDVLRDARPPQEIGLHGGLTHFLWKDPLATREVVEWELAEGVKALEEGSNTPLSFSFAREQEAYHDLLPEHGIVCYRGRTVAPSFRLGPTILGKVARMADEIRRATPLMVWPQQTLPGLWNIPSSLFLYPIHPSRTKLAGLQSRIDRFVRGIEAAARQRGIFHYCMHPENLAESPQGFAMFQEMLGRLNLSRTRGDIEILTMRDVAVRMERARKAELRRIQLRRATTSLTCVK